MNATNFCDLQDVNAKKTIIDITDWYEIGALTDHENYYVKIELDLRKFSNGPFLETKTSQEL